MLLQRKNLSHILPCYYTAKRIIPISSHHLRSLCCLASSTAKTPAPNSNFIVGYLINSCGLCSSQAAEASKYLTQVKSTSNADSVLNFLRQHGLDDTQIGKVVARRPKILCASVEKTLEPKLKILQELQFSRSQIVELVTACPSLYHCGCLRRKIELWMSIFGNTEKLLRALQRGKVLLSYSIDKKIMPNLSLLRDCGVSDSQVGQMILCTPRVIGKSLDSLKIIFQRIDELEVPRGSTMFLEALHTICCHSRSTINYKLRLLRDLGWSKSEIACMITKRPKIFDFSETNIRDTLEFLTKQVGCELSYVANRPTLFTFSLERRLIPRYRVIQILKAKGLSEGGHDFYSIVVRNEKIFLSKYVLPHKGQIPELEEAYLDAARKIAA